MEFKTDNILAAKLRLASFL